MRLRCAVRTAAYTLRYWMRGGVFPWVVSGHAFGEPSYRLRMRTDPESGAVFRAEDEVLRCRCGAESVAWRPA